MKTRYLLLTPLLVAIGAGAAAPIDVVGPTGSMSFGATVNVLDNGNVIVTDPEYSTSAALRLGAVYLYSVNGTLISTLTGSSPNDIVGSGGIVPLTNGNFVVVSDFWVNKSPVDPENTLGAVTWVDGRTGLSGVVSSNNSIVGATSPGFAGQMRATALPNGNYVVQSNWWTLDGYSVGAVTLGSGSGDVTGQISIANSLYGSTQNDDVGIIVKPLPSSNFLVITSTWSHGAASSAGAVTWCSGTTGCVGPVSAANSLIGSTPGDEVGNVAVLANGNYVVTAPWRDAKGFPVCSATWGDGTKGVFGEITEDNSLLGDETTGGAIYAVPLSNGNYVVGTPHWHDVGAATWADGFGPTADTISAGNSLVGTTIDSGIGQNVVALTNGNYVLASPNWSSDNSDSFQGAVTWVDGSHRTSGIISQANSFVGSSPSGYVGAEVLPLANGNYVASSASWDDGNASYAGEATWFDGSRPTTGISSSSNSLVGVGNYDEVAIAVVGLANGNYVVGSANWDGSTINEPGAATWGDGTQGVSGFVTPTSSLVGDSAAAVGLPIALNNGSYLLVSSAWNQYSGVILWEDGTTPLSGTPSLSDGLRGATSQDEIGFGGVTTYKNNNYVVFSPSCCVAKVPGGGAVTLLHGNGRPPTTLPDDTTVYGLVHAGGFQIRFDYNENSDVLAVGRQLENVVSILNDDPIFKSSFD